MYKVLYFLLLFHEVKYLWGYIYFSHGRFNLVECHVNGCGIHLFITFLRGSGNLYIANVKILLMQCSLFQNYECHPESKERLCTCFVAVDHWFLAFCVMLKSFLMQLYVETCYVVSAEIAVAKAVPTEKTHRL